MPSAVLFSNASFDEPAQATVLRSIETVKRTVLEDGTLKLYEGYCRKNENEVEKTNTLINSNSSSSILEFVDNFEDHKTINTILESQPLKIDVTSDLKPLAKKRKLKMIPNKIEYPKTILDSKSKILNFLNNVSVYR